MIASHLIELRAFQSVWLVYLHLVSQFASRTIVALAVAVAALVSPLRAGAANAPGAAPAGLRFVMPADMKSGTLLLQSTQEGRYVEAPRLGTDVDLVVSGPTIRGRVTQIFQNPTNAWVEAVYVYPLSDGSAVDSMKMVIGDRVIVADIKERQQARVVYEQAKAAGQKAALVEQERPNIFTNSIANLGPGETVVVQIEYQEPVRQSGEQFSLRVPLVVAPRYNPAPVVQTVDFRDGSQGWGTASDPVPDRERIEPQVLDPRSNPPVNPVSITVHLNAGFPLGDVKSGNHAVNLTGDGSDARTITLADGPVPADRDFELTWQAVAGKAPAIGLFHEHVGASDYLLAFVTPPTIAGNEDKRPREVVFVIDNSGSMGGTSITQAKASLNYGLTRLNPGDRFNVIRFDHTMTVLFDDTVPADAEHVAQAKAFVDRLEAQGGTEMVPPMRAALTDSHPGDANTLRQVVFLTDGEIGNEQQLFDTIAALRGRSRVFMVGIGSAPNTYLMTRASEIGRGTFTHIGSVDQVAERMKALFEKLESPAVTNLSVSFSEGKPDMTPAVLPDLYRGEPLVLAAKLPPVSMNGTVEVQGSIGDRPWRVSLPIKSAAEGQGISKLWARRKIADAEVARTMRRLGPEEVDQQVLALGLEHHLVTRLTSLVAVDETPTRPTGEHLTRADVPLNLPAGWDFDKVFGERSHAPAPTRMPTDMRKVDNGKGVQLASYAAAVATHPSPTAGARVAAATPRPLGAALPKTATDAELRMLAGLALCLTSLLVLALRQRRWLRAG